MRHAFLLFALGACGCVDDGGHDLLATCDGDASCAPDPACGPPVAFDPQGEIVTARSADACVRLERTPLAARRGTEWRGVRLVVAVAGVVDVDSDAPAYLSSHHNCQDEASADGVRVVVDSAAPDPSACFGDDASAWRVRVLDGATERVLAPDQ